MSQDKLGKMERTIHTSETSSLIIAGVAGFLYLLVVPLGIFGSLYVPSILSVPGDAAATANKLMASESLFRLDIVSDLLASLVLIVVVLYSNNGKHEVISEGYS